MEKTPYLKDYSSLNSIDFYVVPHSQNWEFGKAVEKIVNAYSKTL